MKLVPILIKEGRKENLRKKYSDKFDDEVLDFVFGISDLQDFNHKYTDFVLKTLSPDEDVDLHVDVAVQLVKDFDKFQSQLEKKDINQYNNIKELEYALEPVLEKQKEKETEKQVEKIYEDNKFLVVKPKTHQASCKYGANTKWCTTAQSDEHFRRYTSGSQALYYVINKTNSTNKNYSKVAIHYDGMGNPKYWDTQDNPMTEREVEVFKYAFPDMIDVIENDYKKIAEFAKEAFLKEVFNVTGASVKMIQRYLSKEGNLTVHVEGFETINDLGPGHAQGEVSILLNKTLIDSYHVFITFKSEDKKTFSASIGFMGTDNFIETEDFIDLGLENWGFDSKYLIQGFPENTAEGIRNHISSRVLDFIKDNPELQKKVVGSAKVWTPNRSSYGYTFGKNTGLIRKLIDWLDKGKTGTKLTFLTDIGKLDVDTSGNKPRYSHRGKGMYRPSSDWRGHFSSFFASAKNAGILNYKKVGNQFLLTKGPNFEAFKKGELKAL